MKSNTQNRLCVTFQSVQQLVDKGFGVEIPQHGVVVVTASSEDVRITWMKRNTMNDPRECLMLDGNSAMC